VLPSGAGGVVALDICWKHREHRCNDQGSHGRIRPVYSLLHQTAAAQAQAGLQEGGMRRAVVIHGIPCWIDKPGSQGLIQQLVIAELNAVLV